MNIVRHSKSGGFTLIELLVVIAIIGILSSVVLVSLNSARSKGKDTRIISDVQQVRTTLEGNYNGSVYADLYSTTANSAGIALATTTNGGGFANINTLAADAISQGGGLNIFGATNGTTGSVTVPNGTSYAIFGKLSTGNYFCVASNGSTAQSTTSNASVICQ